MQCSWLRFIARHSSGKLVNTVFLVPSRATCQKDSMLCEPFCVMFSGRTGLRTALRKARCQAGCSTQPRSPEVQRMHRRQSAGRHREAPAEA